MAKAEIKKDISGIVEKALNNAPLVSEFLAYKKEDAAELVKSMIKGKFTEKKLTDLLASQQDSLLWWTREYSQIVHEGKYRDAPDWNSPLLNLSLTTGHIRHRKTTINALLGLLGRDKEFDEGESPKLDIHSGEWTFPASNEDADLKDSIQSIIENLIQLRKIFESAQTILKEAEKTKSIGELVELENRLEIARRNYETALKTSTINVRIEFARQWEAQHDKSEIINPDHPKRRYEEIGLNKIFASKSEPQGIRRLEFNEENIAELVESIKSKGVLEPILLRPLGEYFEIAAGERRFLAAKRAGLLTIPAIITELTDAEVEDIQMHENLHRKDPHPLTEAATYQYLETKRGFNDQEIAAHSAKSVGYVVNRKLLLKLTQKVMEVFRRNEILLSHALEICKYPAESQEEILTYAFSNYGHTSQALYSKDKFLEEIEKHYLLRLDKAIFSLQLNDLIPKTPSCVLCPKRTGANPMLFDSPITKKDSCLDRKCFQLKTDAHINSTRVAVAVNRLKVPEKDAPAQIKKVPLVSTDNWIPTDKKPKEKVFTSDEYTELRHLEDCAFAEIAVCGHGSRLGQKIYICRKNSQCPVHGKGKSGKTAEEVNNSHDEANRQKNEALEKIFNTRVAEAVRLRAFKKALKSMKGPDPKVPDSLIRVIARIWQMQCIWDLEVAERIAEWLELDESLADEGHLCSTYIEKLSKLSDGQIRRLQFLLICESYETPEQVQGFCEEFAIDHQILDAEVRLAEVPMKGKDRFRLYLHELEAGNRNASCPKLHE